MKYVLYIIACLLLLVGVGGCTTHMVAGSDWLGGFAWLLAFALLAGAVTPGQ